METGSAPKPPVEALPGLPDHEVLQELGRGGMGVVYLATNKVMGRNEVLKVVNPQMLTEPGAMDRFLQEIRSAAQLSHPNIVTAHAVLRSGESLVLAMEHIVGANLFKVVGERGPLPVANACYYMHQVAMGLQHANDRGMVHRDIKPDNLMLAREGKKHVVKILDFGLAKATREKEHKQHNLTGDGKMMGTPDYIAPEQILDAAKADIRADIYSLGCTLYFLLTGSPPFQGGSLYEKLQAHMSRTPTSVHELRNEVPLELAKIVDKMMAKDVKDRFQKPADVAQALVPFVKGVKALPGGAEIASATGKATTLTGKSGGDGFTLVPSETRKTTTDGPPKKTMVESNAPALAPVRPKLNPAPSAPPVAKKKTLLLIGGAIAAVCGFMLLLCLAGVGLWVGGVFGGKSQEPLAANQDAKQPPAANQDAKQQPAGKPDEKLPPPGGQTPIPLTVKVEKGPSIEKPSAKEVPPADGRRLWTHSTGRYEQLTDKDWVEQIDNRRYSFREVRRTPDWVELHRIGEPGAKFRNCIIHLHNDAAWIQFDKAPFKKFYDGVWNDSPVKPPKAPPNDEPFVPLFNSKDTTGWKLPPGQTDNWRVEKGILMGPAKKAGYLYSERSDFKNFHLRAKARLNDGSNGGIYFRAPEVAAKRPQGYRVLLNCDAVDDYKAGSLFNGFSADLQPWRTSFVLPGKWFTVDVIAVQNQIVVKVEGKQTANYTDEKMLYGAGHIVLEQTDAQTALEFESIEVREMAPDAKMPLLGSATNPAPPPDPKGGPAPPGPAANKILVNLKGVLNAKDPPDFNPKSKINGRLKVHPIQLTAGKTYVISLNSTAFDAYLRLQTQDGKTTIAEDDDSGGNLNARITHRCTASGVYRIVVSSFNGKLGGYQLIVQESP